MLGLILRNLLAIRCARPSAIQQKEWRYSLRLALATRRALGFFDLVGALTLRFTGRGGDQGCEVVADKRGFGLGMRVQ